MSIYHYLWLDIHVPIKFVRFILSITETACTLIVCWTWHFLKIHYCSKNFRVIIVTTINLVVISARFITPTKQSRVKNMLNEMPRASFLAKWETKCKFKHLDDRLTRARPCVYGRVAKTGNRSRWANWQLREARELLIHLHINECSTSLSSNFTYFFLLTYIGPYFATFLTTKFYLFIYCEYIARWCHNRSAAEGFWNENAKPPEIPRIWQIITNLSLLKWAVLRWHLIINIVYCNIKNVCASAE